MRWRRGSVFFREVEGRAIEAGPGGTNGEESGVMEMSLNAVVFPGVIGGALSCRTVGSDEFATSRRSASYGEGYSANCAVVSDLLPVGLARGVL